MGKRKRDRMEEASEENMTAPELEVESDEESAQAKRAAPALGATHFVRTILINALLNNDVSSFMTHIHNVPDNIKTEVFHLAAEHDKDQLIKAVLDCQDTNLLHVLQGASEIDVAILHKSFKVIQLLLTHDVSKRAIQTDAITWAFRMQQAELLKLMLIHFKDADLKASTWHFESCLFLDHLDLVKAGWPSYKHLISSEILEDLYLLEGNSVKTWLQSAECAGLVENTDESDIGAFLELFQCFSLEATLNASSSSSTSSSLESNIHTSIEQIFASPALVLDFQREVDRQRAALGLTGPSSTSSCSSTSMDDDVVHSPRRDC